MPIMRVIVMIAMVSVMVISGLTLIVIAVGVVTVGIAWSDGNGHLCLRLRRKDSQALKWLQIECVN
jgi:hypothetical protein